MTSSSCFPKQEPETVLTADQQHVCAQLLSLALVRASTTEAALPVGVLPRWSVPLLVGPAGSGKTFVCEEVARRWGQKPCRRWEVGSWITTSNRSSQTTLEQIQAFIERNATGCIVYLAGMDSLGVKAEHNASYAVAMTFGSQILQHQGNAETFLTGLSKFFVPLFPHRTVRSDNSPAEIAQQTGSPNDGTYDQSEHQQDPRGKDLI